MGEDIADRELAALPMPADQLPQTRRETFQSLPEKNRVSLRFQLSWLISECESKLYKIRTAGGLHLKSPRARLHYN